jgi:purine-nucleoside phosphorylase
MINGVRLFYIGYYRGKKRNHKGEGRGVPSVQLYMLQDQECAHEGMKGYHEV